MFDVTQESTSSYIRKCPNKFKNMNKKCLCDAEISK